VGISPYLRGLRERVGHDLVLLPSVAVLPWDDESRKRSLYGEVFDFLKPGGVFANFEHVASPTHRLHLAFLRRSASQSRTRTHPTVYSTCAPSSSGCATSATPTSTAIGSGLRWRY
jgi:hypothetical protein